MHPTTTNTAETHGHSPNRLDLSQIEKNRQDFYRTVDISRHKRKRAREEERDSSPDGKKDPTSPADKKPRKRLDILERYAQARKNNGDLTSLKSTTPGVPVATTLTKPWSWSLPNESSTSEDCDDDEAVKDTRRKRRKSSQVRMPKLPELNPKQYWWNSDPTILRHQIAKWWLVLGRYPSQASLNFLRACMDKKWHYLIDTSKTLKECLDKLELLISCLLYTSPSPRDGLLSRMPSSA